MDCKDFLDDAERLRDYFTKRIAALEAERDELRDQVDKCERLLEHPGGPFCSYCKQRFPGASWGDLTEHTKTCEFHPLSKALAKRDELRARLEAVEVWFNEALNCEVWPDFQKLKDIIVERKEK